MSKSIHGDHDDTNLREHKRKRSSNDVHSDNDDESILIDWVTHTSETYHYFAPDEAAQIRSALLDWYRANRRRLPWRGDKPPYDGSTAGIASKSSTKKKQKIMDGQKSITSFFKSPRGQKGGKKKTTDEKPAPINVDQDEMSKDIVASATINEKIEDDAVRAYRTWVSEIMLQQTRVEAVIPYYEKWMLRFPTVQDLASASEEDVNAHWAGLGFYRRARLLHKGAKYVVNDLGGLIPQTVDELMIIDGIGRYTASAIASIAFDQCVPVVDGNVCRVLSRLKGIANHIKAPAMKDNYGWILAEQIVSAGDGKYAGEVNQALMELGATYCAPSGTGVDPSDPLRQFYSSTKLGMHICKLRQRDKKTVNELISKAMVAAKGKQCCPICDTDGVSASFLKIVEDFDSLQTNASKKSAIINDNDFAELGHSNLPTAPPKKAKREELIVIVALSYQSPNDSKWLMTKRPPEGLLAGQWEFPSSCIWSSTPTKGQKTSITIPALSEKKKDRAIQELLSGYFLQDSTLGDLWLDPQTRTVSHKDPIEHVFSHVRHTMLLGFGELQSSHAYSSPFLEQDSFTIESKEFRWMSESDMQDVGITSGVRKVLSQMKACKP